MNLFKRIIAEIETASLCKQYQKNKDTIRLLMLAMDSKFGAPQVGPFVAHPGYVDHLLRCKADFLTYSSRAMSRDRDKTWGVGDSILAQAKDRIDSINPKLNHALGGMWAHHILQLVNDMSLIFAVNGFRPKNIVVGTPDGNAILVHQEIKSVIEQTNILLNRIRQLYPEARIIIYGLPMTVVDYAIQHYMEYQTNLIQWTLRDHNSVMLLLIEHFVSAYHILPKPDMSMDGVHLTPTGQLRFGDLIEKGKTARARSLLK